MFPANERIACEAPESFGIKTVVNNGFGRVSQKTALTSLKVIWGNEHLHNPKNLIPTGCTVYVSGEQLSHHEWGKQIYTLDGVKFILVPEQFVMLISPEEKAPKVGAGLVEFDMPDLDSQPRVQIKEVQ